MKVSIIVPCYNQGAYIAETLDSVIAQTFTDWECVIVNDGSTDNSELIAKEYVRKDPRIRYYTIENSGVSVARNKAVEYSSGEYILPLDSDDVIGNDYLELAMRAFEENPDLTIVYCKAQLFGVQNGVWKLTEYSYEQLLKDNMIFCSAFYRRRDFDRIGGYDENMKFGLEDWEFWIHLLDYDSQIYVIPKVCFYYRIKEVSRNADILKEHTSRNQMYDIIFLKHYKKYVGELNPLKLYKKGIEIKEQYRRSKEYKLGRRILKPFVLLKNFFCGI